MEHTLYIGSTVAVCQTIPVYTNGTHVVYWFYSASEHVKHIHKNIHVPTNRGPNSKQFLIYFAVSQGAKVIVLDINGMLYLILFNFMYCLVLHALSFHATDYKTNL